jgi:hypothetical protein
MVDAKALGLEQESILHKVDLLRKRIEAVRRTAEGIAAVADAELRSD